MLCIVSSVLLNQYSYLFRAWQDKFYPRLQQYSAAASRASIMLRGLAWFLPAMAKAVPWSGVVRRKGSPRVKETVRWKSRVLAAMWP